MLPLCVYLICLGGGGLVTATSISDMGTCDYEFSGIDNFDFNAFVSEGDWSYCYVPDTTSMENITWAFLHQEVIAFNTTRDQVFRQIGCNQPVLFTDHIRVYYDRGFVTARSVLADFEFQIAQLFYKKSRYLYFHICSERGADSNTDYRFVLAKGTMTRKERKTVEKMDKDYGFKGSIKYMCDKCETC